MHYKKTTPLKMLAVSNLSNKEIKPLSKIKKFDHGAGGDNKVNPHD